LTEAVSFLRSNLVFDLETVSPEEDAPVILPSQRFEINNGTGMISATLEGNRSMDDEDELYELMEEARSPREAIDISTDFDDVSRLFSDDFTLGSVVRTGSVVSSVSNPERWKEPLDAAIKECQRVRECSTKLKEQVQSQNTTIEQLEQENGRLSLNAARRKEESNLTERALGEAKEKIHELRCQVQEIENEKEAQMLLFDERESERVEIQIANKSLSDELDLLRNQKSELEGRLHHLDAQIADMRRELDFATRSCNEYKRRSAEQDLQLSTIEHQVEQRAGREVDEIRLALRLVEEQAADANRNKVEALSKLAQETSLKARLQDQVSHLQQTNTKLISDTEDRDLEIQFAREEFRKERSELKSSLSHKEVEATSLKESLANCKAMLQSLSKEKESFIEKMQSQKSDFWSHLKILNTLRIEFCGILLGLGFDWATPSGDLHGESSPLPDFFGSSTVEIDAWASLLSNLGDEIKVLHETRSQLQEMKIEISNMDTELTNNRMRETDWMQQLENEKVQNEKLWSLLRQAEQEMERSTVQIHEMSSSMTILQQHEHSASSKADSLEAELSQVKIDMQKTSIEQTNEIQKWKSDLMETSSALVKKEVLLTEKMSQL
jgi:chromosome segregation ATPase